MILISASICLFLLMCLLQLNLSTAATLMGCSWRGLAEAEVWATEADGAFEYGSLDTASAGGQCVEDEPVRRDSEAHA